MWFHFEADMAVIATYEDRGSGMECIGDTYYCDSLTLTITIEGSDEINEGATCVFGNTVKLALASNAGIFEVYDMAVTEDPGEFSVC